MQAAAVGAAIEGDDPLEAAIAAARTREFQLRLVEVAGLSALDRLGDGRAPGSSALESVPLAIAAGAWADDFEAAVTIAIRCGGDTDTVGSMAGAIAGARLGAPAIPSRWLGVLEDGEHGRRHVERLATQLAARARRASTLT